MRESLKNSGNATQRERDLVTQTVKDGSGECMREKGKGEIKERKGRWKGILERIRFREAIPEWHWRWNELVANISL